jgi:hypothetical protein
VARTYGLAFDYATGRRLDDLKRWIDEGKPPIALVRYSHWSQIQPGVSTQDGFTGPHFVVVVGYGDGNIVINDPNYWPPRRLEGYRKAWSEELFHLAWSQVGMPAMPNPNNAVIVPTRGKVQQPGEGDETTPTVTYIIRPGDSWRDLAIKFYHDPSRYREILAFNGLRPGLRPVVGDELRIPVPIEMEGRLSFEQDLVLGQGVTQLVDADLLEELKRRWVLEGRIAASADPSALLRSFVDEITQSTEASIGGPKEEDPARPPETPTDQETPKTTVVEYVVQPNDSWPAIAGRFLGDQSRYPEIIAFNRLSPDARLWAGQKVYIAVEKEQE